MRQHTLDEAIIEASRFIKAAKALRASLKHWEKAGDFDPAVGRERAQVLRAALDCRYKLADLRQGR